MSYSLVINKSKSLILNISIEDSGKVDLHMIMPSERVSTILSIEKYIRRSIKNAEICGLTLNREKNTADISIEIVEPKKKATSKTA